MFALCRWFEDPNAAYASASSSAANRKYVKQHFPMVQAKFAAPQLYDMIPVCCIHERIIPVPVHDQNHKIKDIRILPLPHRIHA